MAKLSLPTVTLCAAASVNVEASLAALQTCVSQADFAECLFFTDAVIPAPLPGIRVVPTSRLSSGQAYSEFMLSQLAHYVRTTHCLIVQWDGFVLDAECWDPEFLSFDYIGAPWPQFRDFHDVGNGGFSLRSRRLLAACRDPLFRKGHPEDLAICRVNRKFLEREHEIRFADRKTAERFAFERTVPAGATFGFHGIFNMIPVLGAEHFWQIYRKLDDRSTVFVDYRLLMKQLGSSGIATARRAWLSLDLLLNWLNPNRRRS